MPQSVLLNGYGYYGDCALLAGSNTAIAPKCNVTLQWVPPGRSSVLPYNAPSNPGVHVKPATALMPAYTDQRGNPGCTFRHGECAGSITTALVSAGLRSVNAYLCC